MLDAQDRERHAGQRPGSEIGAAGATASGDDRWLALRRRVYQILEVGQGEDATSKLVDTLLVFLILSNIAVFCAETVPSLERAYGGYFFAFEVVSIIIFTIEYAARLWVAVEVPFLSRMPAWKARLRFARRPAQVIDLVAIAPFYLGPILGLDLRVLRALRLLRFLKLSRYSPAMHTLIRVLKNERRALMGAALLLMAAVLFASTGMYYMESAEQPDKFGSVPESAWWAIATLTTVGYGDVAPVTPLGRLFGAMVMVTGLCILALPVAIISTGFAQEVGRRDFVVTWSLMSRIPLLAELEAADIEQVMPMLHAHNMPPNVEIIGEGAPGAAMFFLASGRVRMTTPHGVTSYQTGDFFGIVAMLENDQSRASFITSSKCRLLKLYREDFHRLEVVAPAVAAHIRKTAYARKQAREAKDGEAASAQAWA